MRNMIKNILTVFLISIMIATPGLADPKGAIFQMTSCNENSDTRLAFNYAENINDGRGITFGCIGFCTGTYDGNILIKYYTTLNASNSLAKYIPALNTIDAGAHTGADGDGNPSTVGLTNFISDVNKCSDPLFKTAQVYEIDQMYFNPAQSEWTSVGATYQITKALMYDAAVREGPDGMIEIVTACGGTPRTMGEVAFDRKFITEYTKKLQAEGLGDTDRMDGYTTVLNSGNYNLATPFQYTAYGDSFTITGDLGLTTTTIFKGYPSDGGSHPR